MREALLECCRQLRLSSKLAENAMIANGATNQEYLLEVLKAEIGYRNIKRRNLYLKKAGFDNIKTFQGYDFEDITLPSDITVDLLKQAEFLARQENLILYGRNGTGKSHMATASEWRPACRGNMYDSTKQLLWSTNLLQQRLKDYWYSSSRNLASLTF